MFEYIHFVVVLYAIKSTDFYFKPGMVAHVCSDIVGVWSKNCWSRGVKGQSQQYSHTFLKQSKKLIKLN